MQFRTGRFIIDPDGLIQAFQHVCATGGKEATPAG